MTPGSQAKMPGHLIRSKFAVGDTDIKIPSWCSPLESLAEVSFLGGHKVFLGHWQAELYAAGRTAPPDFTPHTPQVLVFHNTTLDLGSG